MNKTLRAMVIVFVIIFLLFSYFLLKGHYNRHKYDINRIPTKRTYDYSSTLCCAFERKNWAGLQLSENFRKKYKTKFDITEYAGRFVSYDSGYIRENGEKLIIISYQKESLFDFNESKGYQMNLYFKYTTTDDGLLDDIEFVRKEKRNKMTGRIIEE